MVFSYPYILTRMMYRTSLTDDNITGFYRFAAKDFNA